MFKNEYQGGAFVEIFSAQGKDPTSRWKLSGSQSAIWKDFDKEVKSFVFILEGSSQTIKMQLPKESKQMLGLIQRFLILQLFIPLGQDFSAELLIADLANIKRRLYLSTVHKELTATPLHAKIPLSVIRRKVWCNLCIDLVSFTSGIFKGAVFQSLDGIIVSANCKLRKIYTMKLKPRDTIQEDEIYGSTLSDCEPTDIIPRSCQITTDVQQITQVLNLTKIHQNETKCEGKPLLSTEPDHLNNRGQGSSRTNKNQDKSHIAFGSKVLGPPPVTSRKVTSRSSAETTRSTSRQERSLQQPSHEREDGSVLTAEMNTSIQTSTYSSDQRNKENIQQTGKKEICFHEYQPHPPPPLQLPTTERSRRIKNAQSAGKERNKTALDSSSLGHCRNEDKLSVQLFIPSYERMNRAQTLNNSAMLQASTNLPEEWVFSDQFQEDASKVCDVSYQADINTPTARLVDSSQNGHTKETEEIPADEEEVFTFCSLPRSARLGKSQVIKSLDHSTVSFNDMEHSRRGARMEDDFYGSDSSLEESNFFQLTSSPKSGPRNSQFSDASECTQSAHNSLENTCRSQEHSSTRDSVIAINGIQKDNTSSSTQSSNIKTIDFDNLQKNLVPVRSLSPNGSRPEISKEDPIISRIQQVVSANKLRSSVIKKSLKEISKEEKQLTADAPDYDWRNYQPGRLSASEMQMLASLKRQQNEELEDEGTSHGLSQSQIDHCNVSMSSSSDDTTTWNSCLPPPVNQGCHYQEEMNPLTQSNPRDWLNIFSPPIVPTSQNQNKNMDPLFNLKQSSPGSCIEGDDGFGPEEDEEVLTLLYDPCLNCYFDPETGKYYELA
ncbi:protein CFAP20DC [Rhinophrynus dorsalis]